MLAASAAARACASPAACAAPAAQPTSRGVVIAVLPYGTTVGEIAAVPELAPGRGQRRARLGAGRADLPRHRPGQPRRRGPLRLRPAAPLRVATGRCRRGSGTARSRAPTSAPANIVPGLLASTLARRRDPGRRRGRQRPRDADRRRRATARSQIADGAPARRDAVRASASCGRGSVELRALVDGLGPGRPADRDRRRRARRAGAAAGRDRRARASTGNLTSASTRTDGVVISTDIAPTVLEHLGVEVPDEVNGSEITSGGDARPRGRSPTCRRGSTTGRAATPVGRCCRSRSGSC